MRCGEPAPVFHDRDAFLVAGLIVYTWRRLAGDPAPSRRHWRSAVIIGFFMLVGGLGGVSWAEQSVPSGITALIVAAVPLWIVLVDALRPGGKRPSWQTAAGLLVGMAGILILAGPAMGSGDGGSNHLASVIVLLLATLSWAIGSVYSRGAELPKSPLSGTGMELLAGSVGLYIFRTGNGRSRTPGPGSRINTLAAGLAYLIVIGSLIGFVAYTWLLRVAPTSTVATYAFVNPIVAVVLGSVLAQEVLTPRVLIAIPLILTAVAWIHFAWQDKSTTATSGHAVAPAGLPSARSMDRQSTTHYKLTMDRTVLFARNQPAINPKRFVQSGYNSPITRYGRNRHARAAK